MFLFVSVILSIAFAIKIFEDSIFVMIPLYGLVRFLTNMASIEYILEENTFQYGILALSTAIGSLILTVLLLGLVSGSAHLRIGALLLADIIFLVVRYQGRMKLLLTYSIDKETFKSIALFGLPLLISVGPAWIINESDKFFVARNFNMAVVGYYAAACTIGGVMVTFNTAMINAITPKIYRVLGVDSGKSKSIVLKYVRINCVANFLFGSIFALSYGLFAEYILPDKYQNAKYIVFVIILASMGRALYAVMGLVIDYYKMTVSKLVGISVGAAATAVTCVLGIAKFGVVAAAIGVGVGYIALAIVLWLELAKKFR
jgi:O-antigen/teichoic acid export membrane protein